MLRSAWRGIGFSAASLALRNSDRRGRRRRMVRGQGPHSSGLHRLARFAVAGALAASACSCAVGPDFSPPAPPPNLGGFGPGTGFTRTVSANVPGGGGGEPQRLVQGRDIPGDWWRLFGSRGLENLTDRALKNNPDLASAQAALRVANANLAASKAGFFPTVTGNFSALSTVTPVLPPTLDQNGNLVLAESPPFNLYTGQVLVSYTPDVFGGIRRNVESLQAQSDNQRFQLEAAYLTLTSNIALAAIQEASVRGQIDVTRELIKVASDILDKLHTQRNAGAISDVDVLPQEAAVAQIQQTLPPLERLLEQQRHLLSALSGGLPSQDPPEKFTLGVLKLPRDLPLSIPSQLTQQRPDLRAAEENLHAASAQIGVAIANRLPNLTITGGAGSQSITVAQLFAPGTAAWEIGGSVLQPIFDAGLLYQKEVAARATFEQATSQYRSAVVTAFQNVADSLSALRNDAVALQKAVAAEEAAKRSFDLARKRLDAGDIDAVLLLNVQQTYFQAKLTRVQAQAARYADTVALFEALGGGWWNREDRDPPKHYPFINLGG